MTLLIACRTSKIETPQSDVIYPILHFPEFPVPNGKIIPLDSNGDVVRDDNTKIETVNMPYWYFMLVFDKFSYDYKTTQLEYNAFVEKVK